jgi:hypothetical protein
MNKKIVSQEVEVEEPRKEVVDEDINNIQAPKVKREITIGQRDTLKKGREALKLKKEQQKKEKEEYLQKLAIKKTNTVIKPKMKLKKDFGLDPEDSEEEEPIIQVQPKKSKKKQIVYLPPESDSEEEIIYKKAPKNNKELKYNKEPKVPQTQPYVEIEQKPRIVFF